MAKLEFKFDTKKFEKNINKALEKIVKEEQKKIDIKKTVKEGVEMTLLNEVEEEALKIMIDCISENGNISTGEYNKFPNYIYEQLKDILYKLKITGYIARGDVWLNGWEVLITPLGLSYFARKGLREELFNELSDNARNLLKELVDNEFTGKGIDNILREKIEEDKTDRIIRGMIGTLINNGLISVSWSSNTVYHAELTDAGRTYFEREKKYMEKLRQMSGDTYNINNSGILNMGNIENLNINIDNSIHEIEKKIEEKGNEDKEELKEILQEVKDYLDNIKETKIIGKNGALFKRLSNHLSKHRLVLCRSCIVVRTSLFNDYGRTKRINNKY